MTDLSDNRSCYARSIQAILDGQVELSADHPLRGTGRGEMVLDAVLPLLNRQLRVFTGVNDRDENA
jgi:hypothetical protein